MPFTNQEMQQKAPRDSARLRFPTNASCCSLDMEHHRFALQTSGIIWVLHWNPAQSPWGTCASPWPRLPFTSAGPRGSSSLRRAQSQFASVHDTDISLCAFDCPVAVCLSVHDPTRKADQAHIRAAVQNSCECFMAVHYKDAHMCTFTGGECL